MRNIRRVLRRPRWLPRPAAVVAAVVVGLGILGGASGAVLGELGGGEMHHVDGRHHDGDRFDRVENDRDGVGVGVPGAGPLR
jgi:hypothetical protein